METILEAPDQHWSFLRKFSFRFCFIYLVIYINPWTWVDGQIGFISQLIGYYYYAAEWLVLQCNRLWFSFGDISPQQNGSGDTSFDYAVLLTTLIVAMAGAIIWSLLDHKRKSYNQASYWLRTLIRYNLMITCFFYGLIKWYGMQMPFPSNSELATSLGDLLPMRLSWLFIGYSAPYEMFSGFMEILAGLLMFNRKTITLGLFMALTVFINVMVLNLCYDIPVKLFSIHLVVFCLYLLLHDAKRLMGFFIFNRASPANTVNSLFLPKKWMRVSHILLKIAFFGFFFIKPFFNLRERQQAMQNQKDTLPLKSGMYDVLLFAVNKDTIPGLISDTLRWKDLVIEKTGLVSVGSTDTVFRQRYRRGYCVAEADTASQILHFKKSGRDSVFFGRFQYHFPDSSTVTLKGRYKNDSLFVLLKRSNRHFQLAERQFHWISESNR